MSNVSEITNHFPIAYNADCTSTCSPESQLEVYGFEREVRLTLHVFR